MPFYTRYATGPGYWTNGGSPGINATFLKGVEDALSSLSDGTGAPSVASVTFPVGSISRITKITGTGSGTFNHGLGTTPDFMMVHCTTTTANAVNVRNYTATQFDLIIPVSAGWEAIAVKM